MLNETTNKAEVENPINEKSFSRESEEVKFNASQKILLILSLDRQDIITSTTFVDSEFDTIEYIQNSFFNFIPFESHEELKLILNKVKQHKKQANYECTINDKNGIFRLVTLSVLPQLFFEKIIGLTIMINEKIDSKNAIIEVNNYEDKLNKYEKECRSAFDELLVGVVIRNSDTKMIYCNSAASVMLGLSKENLLSKTSDDKMWVFVNENLKPIKVEDYPANKVILTKKPIKNYTLGVIQNDTNIVKWLNVNAVPFFNENKDKIDKIIINFIDITEQKNAQESLQKSEGNLLNIINNIGDPVLVKDHESKLRIVNEAFCKLFGLSQADIIGKTLAEDVSDEERELFLQIDRNVINDGIENISEELLTIRGREPRNISTRKTRYIDNEGNKYIIGVIRDITDSKKVQQALIESQRLGAIGEMTSSIAHDFNNSLQAINGNLELIINDNTISVNAKKYLETIKNIVNDTSKRIQLLQRFGGNNSIKNNFSIININTVIDEVLLQSRPIWKEGAEKKGLSIKIIKNLQTIPDTLGISADLSSVLFNIIKNSVEAMPQGGDITIETKAIQDIIFITITDSGVGMHAEAKSRLFQPFYTTKGYELGRGLGMSGVYSIIKEHNGEVYIKYSKLAKGTSIEIALPIVVENDNNKAENKEQKTLETITLNNKKAVLWVDDNESIRTNAGLMLEMLGYKVDIAAGGNDAITCLECNTYDIVFTDIGMPDMNGWQLADYIFEKYHGEIKVVVVSGWGAEINDEQSKNHHVIAVISKPFDIEQIEDILNSIQ